jgi:hypothetical protein
MDVASAISIIRLSPSRPMSQAVVRAYCDLAIATSRVAAATAHAGSAVREATNKWTSEIPAVRMTTLIRHEEHRSMTAEDIVRRTAHEVHHHALDIERIVQRTSGASRMW